MATVVALMSLALVGITLAGLMRHFSTEAIFARAEGDRAQLEQIVIAGSLAGTTKVTLPSELSSAGAKLMVHVNGKDRSIEAEVAGHRTVYKP
jgi:hypothetical protein